MSSNPKQHSLYPSMNDSASLLTIATRLFYMTRPLNTIYNYAFIV